MSKIELLRVAGKLEIEYHSSEEKVRHLESSNSGDITVKHNTTYTQTESNINSSNCTDTSPELELNGLTDLSVNTPNSNCSTNYSKSQFSPNDIVNPTTFIIGGASPSATDNDTVI
jgi:hypothetical protein